MSIVRMGRSALPVAPYEIREEIELWARESGRSASIHFVPYCGWMVRLGLRPDDKRMQLYQQGMAEAPPTEDIWFHAPNPESGRVVNGKKQSPYLMLDIMQMGPSGVREFLEKGNTWSGRGEYGSIRDAMRSVAEDNRERKANRRAEARESSRARLGDKRRQYLRIPFIGVGIDLKSSN